MSLQQLWLIRVVALGLAVAIASPAWGTVVFDWAVVGDAGNAADTTGFGAVSSPFQISRHEVTNSQYTEFLNAKDPNGTNSLGLYNSSMGVPFTATGGISFNSGAAAGAKYSVRSGRGNMPVVHVSWYDAVRFINWLHNGQGSGDTETGAYTLTGGTETPTNEFSIARNAGAAYVLPSENEWYKAAYYKGGGTNAGYWSYATQSNTVPTSDQPPGAAAPSNSANYVNDDGNAGNGVNDGYAVTGTILFDPTVAHLSDVGAYSGSLGAYGTFDMNGNAAEWNDAIVQASTRGYRGGAWDTNSSYLVSTGRFDQVPTANTQNIGFRVASVPEPGLALPLAWAMMAWSCKRRRHDA